MSPAVQLRAPRPEDAPAAWRLVCATGVLDVNSGYAYCATFRHFGSTSVVATADERLAGFVTAYRLPERQDVLFVWQVGVDADFRGQGIATRMLLWILEQSACRFVRHIETTVTASNSPSRALFRRLAQRLSTDCQIGPGFGEPELGPDHEPEELFRIGPLHRSTP